MKSSDFLANHTSEERIADLPRHRIAEFAYNVLREFQEATKERDEARMALLALHAREHLTCGWCGEMMHAPPGFTPPMTVEKVKATVRIHLLDCPKHPIRETERELREITDAAIALKHARGRYNTEQAAAKLFSLLPPQ